MCAYAEARTHDPQIKSRTPLPLNDRGHEYIGPKVKSINWVSPFVTVLVIFKLTKFAVALRLRCGSCQLIFLHYFIIFR